MRIWLLKVSPKPEKNFVEPNYIPTGSAYYVTVRVLHLLLSAPCVQLLHWGRHCALIVL